MKVHENGSNGVNWYTDTHSRRVFRWPSEVARRVGGGNGFGEPKVGGILGGSFPGTI